MNEICTALTALVIMTSVNAAKVNQWNYHPPNYSPIVWFHRFLECRGQSQSPINIDTSLANASSNLGLVNRSIFGAIPSSMTMKNKGYTMQVDVENGYAIDDPKLLPGVFKFVQFHLHWGGMGEKGSEHTLNGRRYFGELHAVHYNDKYVNISVAARQPDGLAVFGFFIEDDYPQDNLEFNQLLKPIIENSANYKGDRKAFEKSFSLETLLPHNLDVYYRYQGSLTTPPCYESVIWSVFPDPIRISKKQAQYFESLVFETRRNDVPILPQNNNYRPLQHLYGRKVTRPHRCI